MNIAEMNQVEPDREKIIYAYNTIKHGGSPVVPVITFPCMLSYIINNNLINEFQQSLLTKLCFIIDSMYDTDSISLVRRLKCQ